jgi:hypothetical protein
MIDWDRCREAYNRDHKTNFKTRKELLSYLYPLLGSYARVGREIYVSTYSIKNAMVKDELPHLPKGHRFPAKKTALIMLQASPDKTAEEIAREVGCSANHVRRVASKLKLKYKSMGWNKL